jgi:hypothetical protein
MDLPDYPLSLQVYALKIDHDRFHPHLLQLIPVLPFDAEYSPKP